MYRPYFKNRKALWMILVIAVVILIVAMIGLFTANGEPHPMTVEDVRRLANKAEDLQIEDFSEYKGVDVSSDGDHYIMVYGVKGGYRLVVSGKKGSKPDRVSLEQVYGKTENGIDIRYEKIEE